MTKPVLTPQEIMEVFINTPMESDYNFLQDDLVKLAQAFIKAASGKIVKAELDECVKVARSLNHFVGDKILEIRSK